MCWGLSLISCDARRFIQEGEVQREVRHFRSSSLSFFQHPRKEKHFRIGVHNGKRMAAPVNRAMRSGRAPAPAPAVCGPTSCASAKRNCPTFAFARSAPDAGVVALSRVPLYGSSCSKVGPRGHGRAGSGQVHEAAQQGERGSAGQGGGAVQHSPLCAGGQAGGQERVRGRPDPALACTCDSGRCSPYIWMTEPSSTDPALLLSESRQGEGRDD